MHENDWDCRVSTLLRERNHGCRGAISTAISWFFDNVEAGIILEDDCFPAKNFFYFCQELLRLYKDNERVMMISGNNFHSGENKNNHSYYFSRYPHIWGWASWRRAWHLYDVDIKLWPHVRDKRILYEIFQRDDLSRFWEKRFYDAYEKIFGHSAYQWAFTCLINNGLSIVPGDNLISNIGFDDDATHIKDAGDRYANLESHEIQFPLVHPPLIERDAELDSLEEKEMYLPFAPSRRNIIKHRLKRICSEFVKSFAR